MKAWQQWALIGVFAVASAALGIWLRGEFDAARTPPAPEGLKVVALGESAEPLLGTTLDGVNQPLPGEGRWRLINFWASWCPPCRAEHPVLKQMAADGVRVAGINMMDDADKALGYLAEDGNPFFAIAADPKGRNRVEWGVTAPPETFIIGGDGTVLFRFVGPLVGTDYETRFVPELETALKSSGG